MALPLGGPCPSQGTFTDTPHLPLTSFELFFTSSEVGQHWLSPLVDSKNTTGVSSLHRLYFLPTEHRKVWAGLEVAPPPLGLRWTVRLGGKGERGVPVLPQIAMGLSQRHMIPDSIYTMECGEGTFLTLKIYTLESLKQKYLYLYMKPTRKKNIENREMYQHLKLSPPMGRLLCSPPSTLSLGGQPYLTTRQTNTGKQEEARHLGGVKRGERSAEKDFGLIFKRSNCTFSVVLLFPTLLHVWEPVCWRQLQTC